MKTIFKPSRQKGVAAVELAFILPIMLILVFGITELGRALYQYNGLVKATRGAVRYLAQYDLANTEDLSAVRNNTIQWAVFGAPTSCSDTKQLVCTYRTTPLVPGLNAAQVTLCDYRNPDCASHRSVETDKGSVDMVTVTIGGTGALAFSFKTMVPFVIPDINFSAIKTTMVARYI
jgi:Flp pilus assembly protein TadG